MPRRTDNLEAVRRARARWQARQEALRPPGRTAPHRAPGWPRPRGEHPSPRPLLSRANTSGYRGVAPYRGRWQAAICVDGRRYHIGVFDTPEEGARAYDACARLLRGDGAVTNASLGLLPGEREGVAA